MAMNKDFWKQETCLVNKQKKGDLGCLDFLSTLLNTASSAAPSDLAASEGTGTEPGTVATVVVSSR
jgi:hypothetical protein